MKYPSLKIPIALAIILFAWPGAIHAASFSFSAPATIRTGQEFSLEVLASSTDRGFNAAEATLSFPKDILEVVSIDFTAAATIFNFWLDLPSFSNENGVVLFSGGTTQGIVGSDIPILTVRMRAKGSGDALITASDASINASDGNGTNILGNITALRLTVAKETVVIPPKPAPQPEEEPVAPPAPVPAPAPKAVPISPPPAAPEEKEPQATEEPLDALDELCSGPFNYCTVRFPIITSVSIVPHPFASDIRVSGEAPEGTHVHLMLLQKGKLYKEVIAVVKEDDSWEAILSDIYAYGVFTLEARAETEENRESATSLWPRHLYLLPPYAIGLFGFIVDWYKIAVAALGLLTFGYGVYFFRTEKIHIRSLKNHRWMKNRHFKYFAAVSGLLVAACIAAVFLWQKDHNPTLGFWGKTNVPCLGRKYSFEDTEDAYITLALFIDGKPVRVPAGLGISPSCIAQIHSHDESGRLHFLITERPMTLMDIIKVTRITRPIEVGYDREATLNGTPYPGDITSYPFKDGDSIVLTYTKRP